MTKFTMPDGVQIKDRDAALAAFLDIAKDAQVMGLAGYTNLSSVRCEVKGLTLGHWQRLWDALGDDVCKALHAAASPR